MPVEGKKHKNPEQRSGFLCFFPQEILGGADFVELRHKAGLAAGSLVAVDYAFVGGFIQLANGAHYGFARDIRIVRSNLRLCCFDVGFERGANGLVAAALALAGADLFIADLIFAKYVTSINKKQQRCRNFFSVCSL